MANTFLRCSFCGRSQEEPGRLIRGLGVVICDTCIDLCNEIFEKETNEPHEISSMDSKSREFTAFLKHKTWGQGENLWVEIYHHYGPPRNEDIELEKRKLGELRVLVEQLKSEGVQSLLDDVRALQTGLNHEANPKNEDSSLDEDGPIDVLRRLLGKELMLLAKALCGDRRARPVTDQSTLRDLLAQLELSESEDRMTRISAASQAAALADRWMLELIGEAVASPNVSWGQIGRRIRKLESDGSIVTVPISRQAARQRFIRHAVVEEYSLITKCKKLSQEIGRKRARIGSIRRDDSRNKAEKDRDIFAVERGIQSLEAILRSHKERLDELRPG